MTTDECGGVSPRFVLSFNGLDRVQLHECSLIGTDPAVPVIVPGVADEASWSRTKQGAGSMAACTGTHGSTLKWKHSFILCMPAFPLHPLTYLKVSSAHIITHKEPAPLSAR